MSVYCISDLHGQIGAFHEMLNKIGFSSDDTLYIIGDVVDRGPCGIDILQEVMKMPNVKMLLGNHELMMFEYFSPDATEKQINRWNRNRNVPTLRQFKMLPKQEQEAILDFVRKLPNSLELTVGDTRFFLVHGWPGDNTHDSVWGRPTGVDFQNPLIDRQLIVGHTPVSYLLCGTDEKEDAYLRELEEAGDHVKILHAPGFIDIDCGCGYPYHSCALGCLRLDDMEEFYVSVCTVPTLENEAYEA